MDQYNSHLFWICARPGLLIEQESIKCPHQWGIIIQLCHLWTSSVSSFTNMCSQYRNQPFMSIQKDCLLLYLYLLYYVTCRLEFQYMHTTINYRILLMPIMNAAYPLDTGLMYLVIRNSELLRFFCVMLKVWA